MICPNRALCCRWEGVPKSYILHNKEECLKVKVKCPLKNCAQMFFKDEIEQHQKVCPHRLEKCQECTEYYESCLMEAHKEKCPKKKIGCPQNCFMQIARDTMVKHIKEFCPNTLVHCKLFDIGCKDSFLRKDIDKHDKENMNKHQSLFNDAMLMKINGVSNFINKKFGEFNEKFDNTVLRLDTKINSVKNYVKTSTDRNSINSYNNYNKTNSNKYKNYVEDDESVRKVTRNNNNNNNNNDKNIFILKIIIRTTKKNQKLKIQTQSQ